MNKNLIKPESLNHYKMLSSNWPFWGAALITLLLTPLLLDQTSIFVNLNSLTSLVKLFFHDIAFEVENNINLLEIELNEINSAYMGKSYSSLGEPLWDSGKMFNVRKDIGYLNVSMTDIEGIITSSNRFRSTTTELNELERQIKSTKHLLRTKYNLILSNKNFHNRINALVDNFILSQQYASDCRALKLSPWQMNLTSHLDNLMNLTLLNSTINPATTPFTATTDSLKSRAYPKKRAFKVMDYSNIDEGGSILLESTYTANPFIPLIHEQSFSNILQYFSPTTMFHLSTKKYINASVLLKSISSYPYNRIIKSKILKSILVETILSMGNGLITIALDPNILLKRNKIGSNIPYPPWISNQDRLQQYHDNMLHPFISYNEYYQFETVLNRQTQLYEGNITILFYANKYNKSNFRNIDLFSLQIILLRPLLNSDPSFFPSSKQRHPYFSSPIEVTIFGWSIAPKNISCNAFQQNLESDPNNDQNIGNLENSGIRQAVDSMINRDSPSSSPADRKGPSSSSSQSMSSPIDLGTYALRAAPGDLYSYTSRPSAPHGEEVAEEDRGSVLFPAVQTVALARDKDKTTCGSTPPSSNSSSSRITVQAVTLVFRHRAVLGEQGEGDNVISRERRGCIRLHRVALHGVDCGPLSE